MLYELGSFLFRLGIAVTVVYAFTYIVLSGFGVPVPRELASANGFTQLLSTLNPGGVAASVATATAVLGAMAFAESITRIFGLTMELEIWKLRGLIAFIGLFTVAHAGILTVLSLLEKYVAWALPPLAPGISGLVFAANAVTSIALGYYLLVKAFGAPAF